MDNGSPGKRGTALLEIGTEELPASFFFGAVEQLRGLMEKKLPAVRLEYDSLKIYGTPRRVVLEITGLPARQPDQTKEARGPAQAIAYDKEGKPTQALLGFLKGQGAAPESVRVKDVSGKPYVFVEVHEKGKDTPAVLSEIFPEAIRQLSFPKSMRWDGDFAFGRPIRWLLALFEGTIVPFKLAGLESGNVSYGHRFLSTGPVPVPRPSAYSAALKEAFVVPENAARMELVKSGAESLAQSKDGRIYRMDSLLEEVTLLVEYPTPFLGTFEQRFLSLPQDVLITVMQHHQRYFPVVSREGKLLNYFVAVRNGNDEGLDEVRSGNEQVLRARFKDAEYFFETDKKKKLIDRVPSLEKLVFQKNLGTMKQKVERLQALTRELRDRLAGAPGGLPAAEAARLADAELDKVAALAKCDLTTQMVFELPELQGVMGREYAAREGYPEWICQAILDHYLPRFQGDDFPKTLVGALLGIADRIDTLTGCFALGLKPSGSSDPLGLRRAATTLLQILIEKNLEFDLESLTRKALAGHKAHFDHLKDVDENTLVEELKKFFTERNETLWKAAEIRYDLIRALEPLVARTPLAAHRRAKFLQNLRSAQKEKFDSFVVAWVRVFNILKSKEAQAIVKSAGAKEEIDPSALAEEAEKNLLEELTIGGGTATGEIEKTFTALARFEAPINAFFDKVLVMSPDEKVRRNRLLLLWKLQNLMLNAFGDLTQIVLD